MAAAAGPPTEVLGKGGFGLVFTPAMNNINASGTRKSFPGYVTKVFFKESSYRKALADADMLKEKLPALAIPYSPYEHVYKLKDLNSNVIDSLVEGRKGQIMTNAPAYMLRMPNLGVSLRDFADDPILQARYKASVPFEKKVQEVYKLMTIVKAIGEVGVIHGDIRDYNILINVDTGDMTIIDFDLLLPKEEFLKRIRTPFYSFPPEMTYLCSKQWGDFTKKYLGETKITESADLWKGFAKTDALLGILNRVYIMRWPSPILGNVMGMTYEASQYYNRLQEELRDKFEAKTASDKDIDEIMALTANTVDSYGLGYSLSVFFMYALSKSKEDSPLNWYIRNPYLILMTHPDPTKRMTIDAAMINFKAYIQREYKNNTGKEIEFPPDTPVARLAVLEAEVDRLEELGTSAAAGGVGALPVVAPPAPIARRGSAGAIGAVPVLAPSSLPPNPPRQPSPIARRGSAGAIGAVPVLAPSSLPPNPPPQPSPIARRGSAASTSRVRSPPSSATRKRNKPKSKSKTAANQ